MRDLTVVIPFWNGHQYLPRLLGTIPESLPVVIVDDHSDEALPQHLNRGRTRTIRLVERGYFAGAVNAGIEACDTDVLVLNQDAYFEGDRWMGVIEKHRGKHAIVGEGVFGHPAWPKGYVQGTFMFIQREAWQRVGPLDAKVYPLWGCTCEWQLRACRLGYSANPLRSIPDFVHAKHRRVRWGEAITSAIIREPEERARFIRTPPMVSVIVPCYNYANYLPQAIASMVGGETDLGAWEKPGQTFQSFEVIIVDDASPDNTAEVGQALADAWQGIRYIRLPENKGTAGALNAGIKASFGQHIHILSADDLRRPYTLEHLLKGSSGSGKTVAYGDLAAFRSGKILKTLKMAEFDCDKLLHKNMIPAGMMFPRLAWVEAGGYPEVMGDGREDWAFNIAIASKGWCGRHIGDSGNLVRREGTNRSIINAQTKKKGHSYYKRKLMDLYPELYARGKLMGCPSCGGRRRRAPGGKAAQAQSLPAPKGAMVLIEYRGGNNGVMTWDAPSRTRYRFGGSRKQGWVQPQDVDWFLNLRKNTRLLFRRVPVEQPQAEVIAEKVEVEQEPAAPTYELTDIKGVGKSTAEKLRLGGYLTVAEVAEADADEMAELCEIVVGFAKRYIAGAQSVLA
jgi:glycosyltransferase involved in cell wall biosynthesis